MSYYSFSQVCITLVKQIFHLHIKKSTTILEDYQPWEGSQKNRKNIHPDGCSKICSKIAGKSDSS
jgi:hypothetical protein